MLILIGVFFAGLIVFHLLERVAPIYPDRRRGPGRRAYAADIIAAAVDGPILSGLTKLAAFWLVTRMPAISGWMTGWPRGSQLAVYLLANDLARYWLHRWYHESDVLWRVHRVHHTVVEMDALSTFRVHLFEAAIKYGLLILPFRLAGIDAGVMILYSAVDILKGFWHHANLRTYIGPLNYVFNSAELHWWHHSAQAPGQRSNYGSMLSVWDLLFGTFYWPRGRWPERIGVKGMEAFPDGYLGLFASVRFDDAGAVRAYGAGRGTMRTRTRTGPPRRPEEPTCDEPEAAGVAEAS